MKSPRTTHLNCGNPASLDAGPTSHPARRALRRVLPVLALASATLVAASSQAQTADIVAQPVRVTVPINTGLSSSIDYTVTLSSTNITTPVHLSLASLPAGVSYSFSVNDFITNETGVLTINTTNVAEGVYGFTLDASGGATGQLDMTLQSAHVWTGADFISSSNADFSDSGNWNGGNIPGPGSDVVINDDGGVGHAVTTTNLLVSADTEIGSFRQAITNSATRRDNIQINDGVTLKITGTNGFSAGLRDRTDTYQVWELAFTGNNGTLVVSNQNADLDTFAIENQTPLLDLSSLGTLIVDLRQIHFDDYRVYPNYDNLADNGYAGSASGAALPRRMPVPEVHWAQTNLIHLNFPGDPDNWTNPAMHQYSMMIGNNSSRAGSTQRHHFWFGISNLFEMNSVCFAGAGVAMDQSSGSASFNSAFASDNPTAIFRGPNGMNDRMAMFALADNSGDGSSGSSTKAIVDFRAGTVDALVDQLYIARDRTNASQGYAHGELYIGKGTFDVNHAILGYQGEGNNLNTSGKEDYCQGILTVSSNGVFRANDSIELGYTTAAFTNNNDAAGAGYGQITVSSGGTVLANEILVGGVTGLSQNNTITLNGGNLIVTNTVASPSQMLSTLTMSDSTLTLFVNGTNTTPYVYATNVVTTGGGAQIAIGGIENVSSYPAQLPLIAYQGTTPSFSGLTLPAGISGTLLYDTAKQTIDLELFGTNAPHNLVWRGYQDSTWDTTTPNWEDVATGTPTNFALGDYVTFDDTPGVPTTITVASSVIPGSITVTNNTASYTLSGGEILGSTVLTKSGTGSLEIDNNSTLSVDVQQGSVTIGASGTVASASVADGAALSVAGTVSSGLSCAGMALISGSVSGGLTLQSPAGVVTNLSSGSISGALTFADGTLLDNQGALGSFGAATVVSNSTLINTGSINPNDDSATLTVAGTFEDAGGTTIYLDMLTIGATGQFIPGGNGIGTTTIQATGFGGHSGEVLLATGSQTLFKVDLANPQTNTAVDCPILGLGPSQKLPKQQNGGTLVIQNIGASPFSAGQVFQLFANTAPQHPAPYSAGLNTTNSLPFISPATPGPGLIWDLRQIIPDGTGNVGGTLAVGSVPTTPTNVGFGVSFFSTVSGSTTNYFSASALSWPSSYIGWTLEQQISTNGIMVGDSNWTRIYGSWWTNEMSITNVVGPDAPQVFFRLVYP